MSFYSFKNSSVCVIRFRWASVGSDPLYSLGLIPSHVISLCPSPSCPIALTEETSLSLGSFPKTSDHISTRTASFWSLPKEDFVRPSYSSAVSKALGEAGWPSVLDLFSILDYISFQITFQVTFKEPSFSCESSVLLMVMMQRVIR